MACPMAFLIQMVAAKGCCCVGYSLKTLSSLRCFVLIMRHCYLHHLRGLIEKYSAQDTNNKSPHADLT